VCFQDLGTPNEKIWEGVNELPGFKKCTFPQHPYNSLRNRFGSSLTDLGFDLLNRWAFWEFLSALIRIKNVCKR
jgi:cell division cycle 2-like protein